MSQFDYQLDLATSKKLEGKHDEAIAHLENAILHLRETKKQLAGENIYDQFEKLDIRSRKYVLRQLMALYE